MTATSPQTILNAALKAKLLASSAVTALVGQRVFILQAPPGSMLPYVVFQHIGGGWTNDSPRDNVEPFYQVMCWSTDFDEANALNAAVEAALNRQQLATDAQGWNNYWLSSNDFIERVDWAENNQVWGFGDEYSIRADMLGYSPPPGAL